VAVRRGRGYEAGKPVVSSPLARAVEATQPVVDLKTLPARSREEILARHTDIADARAARAAGRSDAALVSLESYTRDLARQVATARTQRRAQPPPGCSA